MKEINKLMKFAIKEFGITRTYILQFKEDNTPIVVVKNGDNWLALCGIEEDGVYISMT